MTNRWIKQSKRVELEPRLGRAFGILKFRHRGGMKIWRERIKCERKMLASVCQATSFISRQSWTELKYARLEQRQQTDTKRGIKKIFKRVDKKDGRKRYYGGRMKSRKEGALSLASRAIHGHARRRCSTEKISRIYTHERKNKIKTTTGETSVRGLKK